MRYPRVVVAALAVAVLGSVPACSRGGAGGSVATAAAVPFVPVDPASASPTDRAIATAQITLRRLPGDFRAMLDLTQAYLQKAREIADPTLYTKAAGILKLLARQRPDDLELLVTEGSLANSFHRFADGLRFGRRAVQIAPDSPSGYGVVIDAANELGHYDKALAAAAAALLADVVRTQPLAAYVIAEGDDLLAAGGTAEANQVYPLVGIIERLYAANGFNVDLELALFDADHHPGAANVDEARKGLAARPSYFGHEVLAWALYRAGRLKDAGQEMSRALALGDEDPLLRFHAAVIEDAIGDVGAARRDLETVLAANPRFSALYLDQLSALAGRLGQQVPAPPAVIPSTPAAVGG